MYNAEDAHFYHGQVCYQKVHYSDHAIKHHLSENTDWRYSNLSPASHTVYLFTG